MSPVFENSERRKRRDPEILVWDRVVRVLHWTLALAFATLYLAPREFPLHAYAGYLVLAALLSRIAWGFTSRGAARFSSFRFTPRQTVSYLKNALKGEAEYYFSHNPMSALMVHALLATLLVNTLLGLLAHGAAPQAGVVAAHAWLSHLSAGLVVVHLCGVLWVSRLHRENYVLAMLTGIRRIPRAVAVPPGAVHPERRRKTGTAGERLMSWLTYRHPFVGSLLLMTLIVALLTLPLIEALTRLNSILPTH
ncbi:MAG: cytochrome b/b6 domain-containing protein [Dechloromonas sp.]|nr:cytochrome b/b6 domain-containing protein [Dechloromonas sp.]